MRIPGNRQIAIRAGIIGCVLWSLAGTTARAQDAPADLSDNRLYRARWAVRGGFHLGENFRIGTRTTHLEGFEVGADVPLVPRITNIGGLAFSPTVTLGGSNRTGADTDGNIYRLMVVLRREIGTVGIYGGFGLGYSFTQARIHEFRNVDGWATQYTLGYLFHTRARVQPLLEVTYHAGSNHQTSGFSFNIGARF